MPVLQKAGGNDNGKVKEIWLEIEVFMNRFSNKEINFGHCNLQQLYRFSD